MKSININFRAEISEEEKEKIRELIEDNLGIEILEINEGLKQKYEKAIDYLENLANKQGCNIDLKLDKILEDLK